MTKKILSLILAVGLVLSYCTPTSFAANKISAIEFTDLLIRTIGLDALLPEDFETLSNEEAYQAHMELISTTGIKIFQKPTFDAEVSKEELASTLTDILTLDALLPKNFEELPKEEAYQLRLGLLSSVGIKVLEDTTGIEGATKFETATSLKMAFAPKTIPQIRSLYNSDQYNSDDSFFRNVTVVDVALFDKGAKIISDVVYGTELLLDGETNDELYACGLAEEIVVDLGKKYNIGKLGILWDQDTSYQYQIEASVNGEEWHVVVDKTEDAYTGYQEDKVPVLQEEMRYIRIKALNPTGKDAFVYLKEIKAYSISLKLQEIITPLAYEAPEIEVTYDTPEETYYNPASEV